jgi:hypothetical protein
LVVRLSRMTAGQQVEVLGQDVVSKGLKGERPPDRFWPCLLNHGKVIERLEGYGSYRYGKAPQTESDGAGSRGTRVDMGWAEETYWRSTPTV